jgi:hypothetical protein
VIAVIMSLEPRTPDHDYDGFWKDLLEQFLPELLALVAPDLLAILDLDSPVEALEQELHELFPEDRSGDHFVDKLLLVRGRDGTPKCLLLHVDQQEAPEPDFTRRMFRYRYRIFDKRDLPFFALALLGEVSQSDGHDTFEQKLLDCELRYKYRVVNLRSFETRLPELEASDNPAALLLAAYLRTKNTRPDRRRLQFKLELSKAAIDRPALRPRLLDVLRLVDWLMRLPTDLKLEYRHVIDEIAKEKSMPILMDIEIEAEERGRAEGRAEGDAAGRVAAILALLRNRLGADATTLGSDLGKIRNVAELDRLVVLAAQCGSIEHFRENINSP